ncbi:MAG: NifU family protein, partial [Promethearchaeota archaeon]
CAGCPYSQQTLSLGIERAIKQFVPEVKAVQNVM